ncbi:MAG TPA: hypothetical protein VLA24_16330, partial [Pseudomonadales bacterium]|nr:hypothetical protein [Pseudomonadales bacterium]
MRTLTITTAANSAETITITLNGTAVEVTASDASGDANFTAYEIAQTDFSAASFYADSVGDTVVFTGVGVG